MRLLFMTATVLAALFWTQISIAQESSTSTIETNVVEKRAREIGQSLRCVVCQNQSIDESDAPLASDMRKLVRKRITEGDSNAPCKAILMPCGLCPSCSYWQDYYGLF